ncbi:uncharacterized protein LOC123876652 [Maniola jurtina]|uniref:uncharacterized protein LOC123876652 n=1 Tax=Maniola jurtina TaxID=191418 RepID=UPI001E68A973|nr:uncharacterized protein LOC123876652 [Maniola jurtina]XP_045778907.1 uncharacterized protein LOC123876652 [Maniola jurtina]XP_045778908.1 uncharacterized protein LOC123876652 [Maniola jurtina]
MAGTKLIGSTTRLLLLSFPTFIMLSAAVVTEETRKCYWCGPLAEQVHRSRRAPACDASASHVTACEPDLPHCAVVATSPPYVESRLCVKLYQDECYPLFCNSTKSWKMTCPCRGDLCNGPNTERENEAFNILAKLVAKTRTTRIRKRTEINTVKFIPSGDEKTVIITNISALESNELNNENTDMSNDKLTHIMLSDEQMVTFQEMKEDNIMLSDITSTNDDMGEVSTEAMVEIISETTTEKITPDSVENIHEVKQIEKRIGEVPKPSEPLPTAEALQQNASPNAASDKTPAPTSSETTFLTTTDDDSEVTTETTLPSKNSSKTMHKNIFDILVCLNILTYTFKYMQI